MTNPTIPVEALKNHVAVLGKTGAGKSNAAKTVVEDLLDAQERVCAIDPTGTWWGLRLRPNGKPSQYKVLIFGGQHADVQISARDGAAIAEVVGTSATSCIIDTRMMTVSARTQFFTDFAEALLRSNKGVLNLIIDEAHVFAPKGKVADPKSGAMLGAATNLVSLGRGIGLRIMLLSQRPAKLHNDALGQVETLVAMRMILPHDRDAVMDWVKEQADVQKGREITASLPSLPTGDAWVWCPQLDLLERRKFRLARTKDTGKPLSGDEAGVELAPLQIKEVTARLAEVAAEVVANDPRTLKAEIAALKKQLASQQQPTEGVDERAHQAAVEAAFLNGVSEGEKRGNIAGQALALTRVRSALDAIRVDQVSEPVKAKPTIRQPIPEKSAVPAAVNRAPAPVSASDGSLTAPQRKVLEALAFWTGLDIPQPTRTQVGAAAGYSPSSGGFANLLGTLRTAGLIDYPAGGCVALTAEGQAKAPASDGRSVMDRVNSILSGPQARVLAAILRSGGSREEIAEATGYSATSGGFANLLGSLRSLGLIDYPGRGQVEAAAWLFP